MADRAVPNQSALAGLAKPGLLGASTVTPGVRIREVTDFAALTVIARRGKSAEVAEILSRHVGGPVADAANRTGTTNLSASGTAPGQWLAISRGGGALLENLRADLSGRAAVTPAGVSQAFVYCLCQLGRSH